MRGPHRTRLNGQGEISTHTERAKGEIQEHSGFLLDRHEMKL